MLFNITASHASPMVTYVPGALWRETMDGNATGQSSVETYHSTSAIQGEGRVFFTWFGSGSVWIFGARRPSLGPYQVLLDGQSTKFPGFRDSDTASDDAILFHLPSSLPPAVHRLELINTGGDALQPILDLNRIVVQNEAPNVTEITSRDPRCKWGPTGTGSKGWSNNGTTRQKHNKPCDGDLDAQLHARASKTHLLNASQGSGISVYGTLNPNSSSFAAIVDGWASNTLYPNSQLWLASEDEELLYTTSGLLPGNHTLVVRNSPPSW
ncbi:uncharacterized protein PHACADRAFT_213193, partial [Phanerochaete carnosa HHB-10118-sp]